MRLLLQSCLRMEAMLEAENTHIETLVHLDTAESTIVKEPPGRGTRQEQEAQGIREWWEAGAGGRR